MTLPSDRAVTAGQYFVYSCEKGELLLSGGEEKICPDAATKLFTAYVALQYLTPGQTVNAGKVLEKVPADAPVAGIQKKDTLTTEDLVAAMLLSDGNDAAWMLAEAAGRMMYGKSADKVSTANALERFMTEMNDQAKLLGMDGTHFDNPGGIHSENHYSTCRDLAILAMAALEDPVILRSSAAAEVRAELAGETVTWSNPNRLTDPDSPVYCEACVGLKTGETAEIGHYLLAAFEYRGRTVVVGLFGCQTADDMYRDALQLLNKALEIS